MKRRSAIKYAILSTGSLLLASGFRPFEGVAAGLSASAAKTDFGVQLFTIPGMVDKDFRETLKTIHEIGYKEVEFFGPYPFSADETKEQWAPMKSMLGLKNDAFYGFTVQETAQMLKDFNLTAPSLHADITSMRKGMAKMLDGASVLNPKYLVIPALIEGRSNLDDYKKLAEEFNRFGEQMSSYNMKFVYHNHGYEHIEMDGQIPMDFLLQHTDPNFVQFELDIFWMRAAGADPVEFLKKYPNRFMMLHLKDASESFRFSGDGGSPDQWMAGFSKMSDPGDGVLNVKEIMQTAIKSGARHLFLERDLAPEPLKTLKNSFKNLKRFS